MRTETDPDPVDHTAELAETLGIDLDTFLEVFGANWRPVLHEVWYDDDADASGGRVLPSTPWHIAGEPPQLMIQVFPHGAYVARPEGIWAGGTHDLRYQPSRQQYVAHDDVAGAGAGVVRRLLTWRRRSFRYCIYCREPTPPERRLDQGCCHACGTTWLGVVY